GAHDELSTYRIIHHTAEEGAIMAVKPIPKGYHTVTPHIRVQGTAKLIDFLKQAFDAKEIHRLAGPHGTVMHAECRIGDSMLMLGYFSDDHGAGARARGRGRARSASG